MRRGLFDEACLPLETVLLFIAGMTVFIAGILLFPVYAGVAPYYENGLYGLLLFFFALQTVMLGKTPFGELPVSKPLLAVGVTIASIGIVTCFIPGIPNKLARWMLVLCLAPEERSCCSRCSSQKQTPFVAARQGRAAAAALRVRSGLRAVHARRAARARRSC